MSLLPEPEEFYNIEDLIDVADSNYSHEALPAYINSIMKEYAKAIRDKTLEWASKNVHFKERRTITGNLSGAKTKSYMNMINTDFIMNGKEHTDLKIK